MVDPRDDDDELPEADRATSDRDRERAERDRYDRDRNELPESLRQRLEAMIPEIVKKTFQAGMGAVFSTEQGIRNLAKDTIPDVAGYIANTADTTKDKVLEVAAREIRDFLHTMNFTEEIAKLLTTLSFEIKTEIRFIPNSEKYSGVQPDVKASARLKRSGTDRGTTTGEDDGVGRGVARRFWRREDGDDDEGGGGER